MAIHWCSIISVLIENFHCVSDLENSISKNFICWHKGPSLWLSVDLLFQVCFHSVLIVFGRIFCSQDNYCSLCVRDCLIDLYRNRVVYKWNRLSNMIVCAGKYNRISKYYVCMRSCWMSITWSCPEKVNRSTVVFFTSVQSVWTTVWIAQVCIISGGISGADNGAGGADYTDPPVVLPWFTLWWISSSWTVSCCHVR